jgi:hypothetical protein
VIDVAAFILLAVMAVRINMGISRERAIFAELKQSRVLGLVVLLYPLAPVVAFFGTRSIGGVAGFVAAAFCFAPGLVLSRRCMSVFQRSGTDRSDRALAVATQAFGTAFAGLLYLAAVATVVGGSYMRSAGEGGA